jgi:sortase (surface protein transpeptidase)
VSQETEGAGVPRGWAHRLRPVRGWAWLAIAAGVALALVLGIVGWRLTRGVEEYGATVASPPAPTTNPTASAVPVPVTDGQPPAATPVRPIRLEIPTIDVAASVKPVGIDQDTGEVEVPRSVDTVGWYRYGPDLGSAGGSVVIAGHVDSAEQGKGAFFRLRDLAEGAQVRVTGSDGAVRTFTVRSREVFEKAAVPLDRLFARDGDLRLTLVTCGGSFDAATRHYRDNIVLTASPS